jgi:hypothetical protein
VKGMEKYRAIYFASVIFVILSLRHQNDLKSTFYRVFQESTSSDVTREGGRRKKNRS